MILRAASARVLAKNASSWVVVEESLMVVLVLFAVDEYYCSSSLFVVVDVDLVVVAAELES